MASIARQNMSEACLKHHPTHVRKMSTQADENMSETGRPRPPLREVLRRPLCPVFPWAMHLAWQKENGLDELHYFGEVFAMSWRWFGDSFTMLWQCVWHDFGDALAMVRFSGQDLSAPPVHRERYERNSKRSICWKHLKLQRGGFQDGDRSGTFRDKQQVKQILNLLKLRIRRGILI